MSLRELSDEELVRLSNRGDADATDALIGRYKNAVRARARTFFLAGGDTEDILQEGMIGLYRAIKDYNGESSFKNFAFLCIRRQIINAIKRAGGKKHQPLNEYTPFPPDEFLNRALSPEEIFIGEEELVTLNDSIQGALSGFEKKILRLFLAGLSYQEMAAAYKKDIKSIDNAIQRIRKKVLKIKSER